jgi:hypothetical protein
VRVRASLATRMWSPRPKRTCPPGRVRPSSQAPAAPRILAGSPGSPTPAA